MRNSCNGCRGLGNICTEDCSIRPCLRWINSPDSQAYATVFLAKFYGLDGLMNLINAVPVHLGPAVFRSLLYEACERIVNPVYPIDESVGFFCSGNLQLCHSAVEAVLRGDSITQVAAIDAARADNGTTLMDYDDFVQVPKGENSNDLHKGINLPEEIVAQILEKLPVKSVLRCMCVQKSWYSLIKSPRFVTAHLNYQKTHHCYLLLKYGISHLPSPIVLHVDDVQFERCDLLPPLPCSLGWQGVSNGLICLCPHAVPKYNSKLYIWNPAIRKLKTLPDPPRSSIPGSSLAILAFGFCPKSNDFKVVKMVNACLLSTADKPVVADVYSLATDSWKTSNNNDVIFTYSVSDSQWVFLNGTAFFRGQNVDEEDIILSYDTDKDVMRQISFPESCDWEYLHHSVQVFGESIAIFTKSSTLSGLNMWVLKEGDTNKARWEKKINFNPPKIENYRWNVLCMRSNGEVLLGNWSKDGRLLSYNVDKDEGTYIGWVRTPMSVYSFAESLVMIDT